MGLPMELCEVPKLGGAVWKRVIDKSLKLTKKLRKITKSLKSKRSKETNKLKKTSLKDDRLLLKVGLEVLDSLREFFGPSASYVSIIIYCSLAREMIFFFITQLSEIFNFKVSCVSNLLDIQFSS